MEARIAKLEQIAEKTSERLGAIDIKVGKIETRLDNFERSFATKVDLAEAKTSIILWVVSAIFLAQLIPAMPALLKALHWIA